MGKENVGWTCGRILVTFKKNKKGILAATWMNHKDVVLREVSLSQHARHRTTPLTRGPASAQTPGERIGMLGSRARGRGNGKWFPGGRVSVS